MKKNGKKIGVHLHRRDFLRLNRVKPNTFLKCDNGVLWVTQKNDPKDYVLLSGDEIAFSRRGNVLVEAMRDAELCVE